MANLLLVLLLGLEALHGNAVQITLASLGDAAATLVVVALKDTDLLEGLASLAVNGAGGVNVVGRSVAAVLGGTVELAETANTDSLAHVDVTGDGGRADVVPGNKDAVSACSLVARAKRTCALTSQCSGEGAPWRVQS